MIKTLINPPTLPRPRGYNHGVRAWPVGRLLFLAGQIGWNAKGELVSEQFVPQFRQALSNVMDVVREAGGTAESVGRLTIYVTDRRKYLEALAEVGAAYRSVMGKHFPAMALVEVAALLEPRALVEIEGTAVIP